MERPERVKMEYVEDKTDAAPKKQVEVRVIRRPESSSRTSITGALTPSRVARALRSSLAGDMREYWDLLDDIFDKDLRIPAELDKRYMRGASAAYEVQPASDDERDVRIAKFVEDNLDHIPRFRVALRDLQEAVYKGAAAAEICWKYYGPELWVDALVPWETHALKITDDTIEVSSGGGGYEAPPPNKFVVHRVQRSGTIRRGGLGRTLLWFYLFKNYSIKDWASFLEAYGSPLRIGKYEPGTGKEDIDRLLDAVLNIAAEQAAVVSKNCDIELREAAKQQSTDAYEKFVKYIDSEVSIRVNGQVLTSQGSGAGGTGSLALGEVHRDVQNDIIDFDLECLADTLNAQLVGPLCYYNFGELDRYPKLVFNNEPAADLVAAANILDAAINKIRLPVAKRHVYETLKIPEPAEGEETIEPASQPVQQYQPFARGFSAAPERAEKPEVESVLKKDVEKRLAAAYEKRRRELIAAAKNGSLDKIETSPDSELADAVRKALLAGHLAGRKSALDEVEEAEGDKS